MVDPLLPAAPPPHTHTAPPDTPHTHAATTHATDTNTEAGGGNMAGTRRLNQHERHYANWQHDHEARWADRVDEGPSVSEFFQAHPEVAHDVMDADTYDGDGVFYGDYSRDERRARRKRPE